MIAVIRLTCLLPAERPPSANDPFSAILQSLIRILRGLLYIWVTFFLLCPPGIVLGAGPVGAQKDAVSGGASVRIQEEQEKKKEKKEPDKKEPEKGKLDNFEKEATDEDKDTARSGDVDGDANDESGWVATVFFGMTQGIFVYGGTTSWHRVHGAGSEDTYAPRQLGEPLIPFFGLSVGYQNVESDVNAASTRLEAGYGPAALHVNWTLYKEDEPASELDFVQWHVLYRMSFAQYVEVDAGLGSMIIRGSSQRSGFSITIPVRIQPVRFLGIVFRPAWGWIGESTISDYELALSASLRFVSIHGGYRWVKVGTASLDGPVVGLAFHL